MWCQSIRSCRGHRTASKARGIWSETRSLWPSWPRCALRSPHQRRMETFLATGLSCRTKQMQMGCAGDEFVGQSWSSVLHPTNQAQSTCSIFSLFIPFSWGLSSLLPVQLPRILETRATHTFHMATFGHRCRHPGFFTIVFFLVALHLFSPTPLVGAPDLLSC